MNNKLLGVTSILTALIFVAGFIVLFIVNPQTYEELNNLSLTAYNIMGMDFRLWSAIVIYSIVGGLNVFFVVLLFFRTPNEAVALIGKVLLLLTGLVWFSLGILPYDPTDAGNNLLLIRVVSIILTSSLGLFFLGNDSDLILKSKFLKWYTLSSGILILLLSLLSVAVFNDTTWIRTNLSFVVYFLWMGVFGTTYLITVVHQKVIFKNKSS